MAKTPVNQRGLRRRHMTSTRTCFVTSHPGKQILIYTFETSPTNLRFVMLIINELDIIAAKKTGKIVKDKIVISQCGYITNRGRHIYNTMDLRRSTFL